MHRLAAIAIGPSFLEGAAFRRAGEARLRSSAAGALLTLVELVLQRRDVRFPRHPYVALTQEELVLLDFRSTTGDKGPQLFGRWPWTSVRITEAVPERSYLVIAISRNRTLLVLKGLFGSDTEQHVVTRMRDIARDGPTGGSLGRPT